MPATHPAIGLQWCARFATLLAEPDERTMLVDYMRQLGTIMARAMKRSLRDADVSVDEGREADEDNDDPTTTPRHPHPPSVPAPRTPPPTSMSVAARDALGMVTATLHAIRGWTTALQTLTRRLIVAFAVHRYTMAGTGYRLTGHRVLRTSHIHEQRRWQELTMREMLASGATRPLDVAGIHAQFGRRVVVLRFVCGTQPGPRYAWPVSCPDTSGRRPRRRAATPTDGHHHQPDQHDAITALEAIADRLRTAARWVESTHLPHHPVLGHAAGTERLLSLLLERVLGALRDLVACMPEDTIVPEVVRRTFHAASLPALTRRFVVEATPGDTDPRPPMPRLLLSMYGQLSDDVRLLRRLEDHGRAVLLRDVLRQDDHPNPAAVRRARFDVDVPVEGLPGLSVRSVSRPTVNWRHVFRSLFPALYHVHAASSDTNRTGPPQTECFRTRIMFDDGVG